VSEKIEPYETDPRGLDPHEPGAKLDAGKVKAALLKDFGLALTEVAKIATYGCRKYSKNGWEKVADGEFRYDNAMMRHWLAEHNEMIDDDSGFLHAAHIAWNALARLELLMRKEDW